jgi:uncharacterized protein (TIGR02246 family)
MKRLVLQFLATALSIAAQTNADKEAVRKLPVAFSDAMTKHDGHELAKTMAADVDFVTVGAMWLHGRRDFEIYHTRLLNARFMEVTVTPLQIAVRFLRPDTAVAHWNWRLAGDKNIDGTKRQPRYGMMTMVAEKRHGKWLVVVAQNDNSNPGLPPEAEGIESPMPIPGPDREPR